MTEQTKTDNSGVGQIASKIVVPALAAALVLGVYYYLYEHNLNLPEPVVRAGAYLFTFLGLAWLISAVVRLFQGAGADGERQFYDALADALGDPAVIVDSKGRAVYANAPFLKLASKAGVSRLVGFDVLYSGYTDFVEPIYQLGQAARDGKAMARDLRLAAGSSAPFASADESKWLRLSVSPMVRNTRGAKTLWRLSDITADRLHQENAFSRLQFIISYLDQAPVGFFSVLPNGRVDYVNATLATWLGFDLATVQSGKLNLSELVGAEGAKVLRAVAPVVGGNRIDAFLLPLRDKAGGTHYFRLINRADFDSDGKPLPARCMVMKAQGAEAFSPPANNSALDKARFMASIPIGYAEIDAHGNLATANAQFLNLSSGLGIGGNFSAALDGASGHRFAELLGELSRRPDQPHDMDCTFAGSETRSAHLSLSQGEAAGHVSLFAIDKTESRLLEAQLAQSQKMQAIGQLSSGLAHDFNNMLTPIIGFADILLSKMRPTDPSFQDVMSIKQNANRAAGLVRHLLAFSRKQTMQPKVYDLSESMADLGMLLKRVVGDKVQLTLTHGRDLWPVMVDIHQLEQVIVNLASNARDAMPQGGKLALSTYNITAAESQGLGHVLPAADYVVLRSVDTGQGIPKEILNKIWDPFFTTKEVGKGTGLGLSMVYGFVKQSGGFIYCDSEVGKGTTFRIFLPRYVAEAGAVVEAKPVEATPVREDFSGRGRVLIVEDEDSVRAFAARALTSRGYTVVEANSGEVGLEVIESDKDGFELILSDVVMPEMDGPTMLKELRKRGVKSKFIFMSGYAEDAFEKSPDSPTDFSFLQKPFSLKQLVEKVKAELG
jgi:two-component system cell cycle sensor histidine kinase/response regulator CckA